MKLKLFILLLILSLNGAYPSDNYQVNSVSGSLPLFKVNKEKRIIKSMCKRIPKYCREIYTYSKQNNMDPLILSAIIYHESLGAKTHIIRGKSGEYGLTQCMPGNFPKNIKSDSDRFNVKNNILCGIKVYKNCSFLRKNDLKKTLSCYNTGPNSKYYNKKYVDKVLYEYNFFKLKRSKTNVIKHN